MEDAEIDTQTGLSRRNSSRVVIINGALPTTVPGSAEVGIVITSRGTIRYLCHHHCYRQLSSKPPWKESPLRSGNRNLFRYCEPVYRPAYNAYYVPI